MAPGPHPHLNTTLGASFLSGTVVAILFGLTSLQTWIYYQNFEKENKILRYMISILWILDASHLVFMTYSNYYYFVIHFGDNFTLAHASSPLWTLLPQIVVMIISDLIVRGIFAWRVWRLSHGNIPLVAVIFVMTLFAYAAGMAFSVKAFHIWGTSSLSSLSWLLYGSLGSIVVVDGFIATSLCVLLWCIRSEVRQTNSIIRVLMLYSINTGLLTSIIAILCLVAYARMPDDTIFSGLFFVLSRLYLNALLANLNARSVLRDNTVSIKSIHFESPASVGNQNRPQSNHVIDLQSSPE